jgi:hypothetical protein
MSDANRSLQSLLAEMKTHQERKAVATLRMQKLNDDISNTSQKIRERIDAGESTGDSLRDLVFGAHGYYEELVEWYRPLQDALKDKQGEFILLEFVPQVRLHEPRTWVGSLLQAPRIRIGVLEVRCSYERQISSPARSLYLLLVLSRSSRTSSSLTQMCQRSKLQTRI